jgi:parallel beta-helix repeat protein
MQSAFKGRGFAIGLVLLCAAPAWAITITVNNTSDLALGGGASCPGTCTLRAAIQTANATAGVDTINLASGNTYTLTISGTGEDAAATGDLDINESVNIAVIGGSGVTVDGGNLDRVFHVRSGSVGMSRVNVRHGLLIDDVGVGILIEGAAALNYADGTVSLNSGGGTTSMGGGIAVGTDASGNASLIISGCTVSNNAVTSRGGGILVSQNSQATITGCTISNNAASDGGGIYVRTAPSNVTQILGTTITGNTATSNGGGLFNDVCGLTEVRNCTIESNIAMGSGGGIRNTLSFLCGTNLTVSNVTVAYNAAGGGGTGDGGGISTDGTGLFVGHSMVGNSIFAWNFDLDAVNTGYAPDCAGRFESKGHDLIQDQSGCTIVGDTTGNRPNFSNPNLGTLGSFGGPTQTIALYAGSDAINNGNPTGGAGTFTCETTDQRGTARPVGTACDIGAFEAPVCGNAVTEAPEACDGGGTCDGSCRLLEPPASHNEPKTAAKTSGNLVTAYAQCSTGNLHTLSPPSPTQTACPATRTDTLCGFATTGTPITGTYSIEPLTTAGDMKVKVELKDLESACNGQTLTVYTSFRETTQNCPITGGGVGSCTLTDGPLQNVAIGSCTVASGNCTVDVSMSSSSSLPQFTKGRRTGVEIQSLVVKRGSLTSFVPGILIP